MEIPTKTITTPVNTRVGTLPASFQSQDPNQVLAFAHKAAKALMDVIAQKPKKVMIRGEQYLTFEDWQTLGRFYGVTVGIEYCNSAINEKKIFGFEAKALAYHSGNIISSACACTFRDEPQWSDKPSFQLKSMAQTRAAAKALRNVLAWVAVLGGFKPTPFEEMTNHVPSGDSSVSFAPKLNETDVENEIKMIHWREESEPFMISDRQKNFLESLIKERVSDEEERERRLANIDTFTRHDAHEMIDELLSRPSLA